MSSTRALMIVLGLWLVLRAVTKDATGRTLIDHILGTGGTQYLNQTGPGQANDPAKVPASPPAGTQQVYKSARTGATLPFPPNSLLDQPSEQTLISWLTGHGWANSQIVSYLKSLVLNVPSTLTVGPGSKPPTQAAASNAGYGAVS